MGRVEPHDPGDALQLFGKIARLNGERQMIGARKHSFELESAARDPTAPLMDLILGAVRARVTVGEISDVLRGVWGVYRPV